MRYASIRNLDVSNGENIGVSLFTQGCDRVPHCKNCFNPETWDFNGGKEWTEETKNKFLGLIDRPYIKRVSILGGEPLADQNLDDVLHLIQEILISFPEKTIWIYTGYRVKLIEYPYLDAEDKYKQKIGYTFVTETRDKNAINNIKRASILNKVNVIVDGEYIDEQKDITLAYRGSKNQRVIDVQKSLAQNKIVLYCD